MQQALNFSEVVYVAPNIHKIKMLRGRGGSVYQVWDQVSYEGVCTHDGY